MASSQVGPPPFQEASRCDVCKRSFNTFRRRHHCRCCGRTLCNEHSSNQMALPQFGIFAAVRVCSDCFNNGSRPGSADIPNINAIDSAASKISKLDLGKNSMKVATGLYPNGKAETVENTTKEAPECKCGMPLCICAAPVPDPIPVQVQKPTTTVTSNPRPRRNVEARRVPESNLTSMPPSSSIKQSLFFNAGQASGDRRGKAPTKYEPNGEGLREAIKNDDVLAVRKLLTEGVDANYCDKQGMTLLHLAALFNRTEIAFILMDHGARPDQKNAQGETPLDCAPAMLQHKMRTKLEQHDA